MSDFEDEDICMEPWLLPSKRKRKKDSIKDKKDQKCKKSRTIKTQKSAQKKSSKFKEAMMEREVKKKEKKKNKGKKKAKKKKKNKLALELDDSFSFTQGSSEQAQLFDNLDKLTQDSVKKAKRRRMVAFSLLPTHVKRPSFTSSSPKESQDVREGDSCSQVRPTGQIQNQSLDNLQCTDDINSQDLFITQKTFKASPSGASSSETSDEVVVSPQVFTQRDKNQEKKQEKSDTCPQDSHQMWRMSQEPKTEDGEEDRGIHESYQWKKMSFQTQEEFKTEQKEDSVCVGSKGVNPLQDESFIINPTQDVATQTENFFTAELSSYSIFCQKSRVALDLEDLQPLDLSLPQRVRKDLGLSVKMLVIDIEQEPNELLLRGEMNRGEDVFASPRVEHVESKKVLACLGGTTPSPQSEAETKSVEMTASSEDDHPCHSGKRDLMQVRAVQLRLNKPFFFKTKGEGQSPRPESPLMKLSQGREPKSKKCRTSKK